MAIIKHSSLRLRGPAQPGDITSDLADSGGARTVLNAATDRAGFWDPSSTSKLDNADLSPVVLEIPDAGNWIIGCEGYVHANAGTANVEIDVTMTALGTDPFVNESYPAILAQDVTTTDSWVQALGFITVTDPVQLAAYLYPNAGAIRVKGADNPDSWRLFAWPV